MPSLKEMIAAETARLTGQLGAIGSERQVFAAACQEAGLLTEWTGAVCAVSSGAWLVCTVYCKSIGHWTILPSMQDGPLETVFMGIATLVALGRTDGTPNPPSPPQRKQEAP